MKKILFVPLLLLTLSSCTIPFFGNKADESFTALYNANIHASIV